VNRLVRDHIVDPEWRFHVKRYMRGEIGSKEVYEMVGPSMRMDRAQFHEFVRQHAELDPAFPSFLQWARNLGIDVKIVSDGFDATIHALFEMHGIEGIEIFANRLEFRDDARLSLTSPHWNPECAVCGTCKQDIVQKFRSRYHTIILIGDGESDRHAAEEADVVLALEDLFIYCARRGIPAIRTDGFHEIPHLLTRVIEAIAFDMDGTLIDSLQTITDSFNHMFAALGYPQMTVEEVARKTSVSLKDFVQSYLKADEVDRGIDLFSACYDAICLEKASLIPGVAETLQSLDGTIAKGVVTNKRGNYARKLADHFSIAGCMARIIGAQDGFKAKPAGDMFEEFMRSVGSSRKNTIYVGDSPIDIEAAHNARIDAFAIAGPIFSAEELALKGARRVLTSINELPTAIRPVIPSAANRQPPL
ncbi:MAG: HAD family hydrolase, partial [Pseudomonadota bacterium]